MEILSALLALCAGNSPVTGEFSSQRPVTRSFYVFFDLRLNKGLSKQSWGWWFETPSWPSWCHCNAIVTFDTVLSRPSWPGISNPISSLIFFQLWTEHIHTFYEQYWTQRYNQAYFYKHYWTQGYNQAYIHMYLTYVSDVYILRRVVALLIHVTTCHLFSVKQLPEPITYFLWTGRLGTNFSEILVEIQIFWYRKMHLKMHVVCKIATILSRPQRVKAQVTLCRSFFADVPDHSRPPRSVMIVTKPSGRGLNSRSLSNTACTILVRQL